MIEKYLECAKETALEAGKILRDGFGTSFEIQNKEGKNNLVTKYDKLSEELIINRIKANFHDHSFLAEESGKTGAEGQNKVLWVIDPLDGTVNFAHSLPIFSVSIAVMQNNEVVAGVIYHPILDELFYAGKGMGAYLNGKRLKVSDNADFDSSFLVTGFPYNVSQNPCGCIDHFIQIILNGIPVRRLGSAALDLAYVACGIFDGFWEVNLKPWDVAAGVLLVEEAGGRVTTYQNTKYSIFDNTLLATNGKIHDKVVQVLSKCHCKINYQ